MKENNGRGWSPEYVWCSFCKIYCDKEQYHYNYSVKTD